MARLGEHKPDGLIAGDFPTEAMEITLTGPAEFKRGDVIAQTGDETYALVDSTGADGAELPIGIICDDIIVEDGVTTKSTMYIKGEFNRRFMRFGGTDTADTHMRRMIEIGLIIRGTRI